MLSSNPMTSLQPQVSPSSDSQSFNFETTSASSSWKIKMLYDGACPLCLREVNFLRRKDAGRGLVKFVDIAAPEYCPEENGGVSFAAAMGRIHAVLPDDTVVKNVEVFRQIYTILGIGWLYAPTRWYGIGPVVDWLYDFWADRRLAWTGRPSLEQLVAQRQQADCYISRAQCSEVEGDSGNRCRID